MKLLVTIPAFNEAENIAKVIKKIPRKIKGIQKVEVAVIDDGSTDNTAKVSQKAGADFIVTHTKNMGLGQALKTAVKTALEKNADMMVNIDADGQLDPLEIPKVIQPILAKKADFVTASRFKIKKDIKNLSKSKRWGNIFLAKFISWAIKQKIADVACGFRAYSKEALLNLNFFGKYNCSQEMFLDLAAKDISIAEVPVEVKYFKNRESKVAKSLIKYGWQVFKIILRSFRDYQPLKFFGYFGAILFVPGLLGALTLFVRWLVIHKVHPYLTYVYVSMVLMIVGFLLIVLALIADMLLRLRINQEKILYFEKKKLYKK